MKLNALDWVVISAVAVVIVCLAMRVFSGRQEPSPDSE